MNVKETRGSCSYTIDSGSELDYMVQIEASQWCHVDIGGKNTGYSTMFQKNITLNTMNHERFRVYLCLET